MTRIKFRCSPALGTIDIVENWPEYKRDPYVGPIENRSYKVDELLVENRKRATFNSRFFMPIYDIVLHFAMPISRPRSQVRFSISEKASILRCGTQISSRHGGTNTILSTLNI